MSVWLYRCLLWCARPLVKLRLQRRARKEPEYGERVAERFGEVPDSVPSEVVWFHTVSAGETLAAVPLIKSLQARFAELPFLVTTMTPTGASQVRERLGEQVAHCYAPYDFPDAVAAFFARVRPRLLVLMETELWPNTIAAAHQAQIPVLLINARLSERSARGYQRVATLTRRMLMQLDHVACQTPAHRDRFIGLGLPAERITVSGSIKYDVTLDAGIEVQVQAFGARFAMPVAAPDETHNAGDAAAPVWIAASTHPGEDEPVLEAHSRLRERVPGLRLILVPRHPVRADEVAELIEARGWTQARLSAVASTDAQAEVVLGDVMGTLLPLYGLAQVAFVGGSLVDVGGHNPIEPGLYRLPIAAGPYQHNFADAMAAMTQVGALRTVTDADDLCRALADWLLNEEARRAAGAQALAVVDANRGTAARLQALVAARICSAD